MFLSFIVPVYNTEDYLPECLNSLLDQDIPAEDFEILCVNDGSPDNSLRILREYEAAHTNIRVIDKPNGGVASARNAGLDAARGDYIWFFDSDDVVKPNILGTLRWHIGETHSQRVKIGAYIFSGEAADYINDAALEVNTHFYDSSVCSSLLSRHFLVSHNCRFHYPNIIHGEDLLFMFEAMAHGLQCTELDIPIYFYRNRPSSAMTAISESARERRIRSHILAAEVMKGYYERGFGDPMLCANLLMFYIWYTMTECSTLSSAPRKAIVADMKAAGLFPFRRPEACTTMSSYQAATTGFIGTVYDWVYIRTHTRTGFLLMRLCKKAYSLLEALRK